MRDKHFFHKQKLIIPTPQVEVFKRIQSLTASNYQFDSAENSEFKISGFSGTEYWLEGSLNTLSDARVEINYISSMKHLDISAKLKRGLPFAVFAIWLYFILSTLGWNYANNNMPENCIYESASGRTSIIHNQVCDLILQNNTRNEMFMLWSWLIPLAVYLVMDRFDFYWREHQAAGKASKALRAEFMRVVSG